MSDFNDNEVYRGIKSNIAVIGELDNVIGFTAVGFDIRPVNGAAEAEIALRALAAEGAAIIYIIEGLAEQIGSAIAEFSDRPTPAIIPIPGASGATGYAARRIKDSIKRAVGMDLDLG